MRLFLIFFLIALVSPSMAQNNNLSYDLGFGINKQLKQAPYVEQGFQPVLRFGILKQTKFKRLSTQTNISYQKLNLTYYNPYFGPRPRFIGSYRPEHHNTFNAHSLALDFLLNYRLIKLKKLAFDSKLGLGFTRSVFGQSTYYYSLRADEFDEESFRAKFAGNSPILGLEAAYNLNNKSSVILSYARSTYFDRRLRSKRVQALYQPANFWMISFRNQITK
jgi:hypothetical protein